MLLKTLMLITYHFPPSAACGSFRLLGFARHLPNFGWRTVVVAPPKMPWEAVDPELMSLVPTETVIEHVPFPQGRILRSLAPIRGWLMGAWRGCLRAMKRQQPDAILTSGPPHEVHLLGLWLKRRYRLPWIADFRDPWITSNWVTHRKSGEERSIRTRWLAREEHVVIREADVLIVNTPNTLKALSQVYPEAREKMVVLTNGYDPERFETLPLSPLAHSQHPRVIHTGQIYGGRDPRPFLDAIRMLRDERSTNGRDIRVDFFGNLTDDHRHYDLNTEIRQRGLEPIVHLGGQIPYAQSLSEMVRSDILLLLNCPGQKLGVPAKLYEYIGAGRPILALAEAESDTAWVLRECGAPYRIASPSDPFAIKEALADLIEELQSEPSWTGSDFGSEQGRLAFSRKRIASRLAQILDGSLNRAGHGSTESATNASDRPQVDQAV